MVHGRWGKVIGGLVISYWCALLRIRFAKRLYIKAKDFSILNSKLSFCIYSFPFAIYHLFFVPLGYTKLFPALAKKGLSLDWEPECSFELISIVSPVRDYRLCWLLNHHLNYQLEWKEDVPLLGGKGIQKTLFNRYAYNDELNWLQYHFINNKYLGESLVPELKQVDHFFLVEGNNAEQEKDRIITTLKSLPLIQAVFGVNPNELRSKKNLIFE